jgi:tetratricopeptide (TPR) repeat protein
MPFSGKKKAAAAKVKPAVYPKPAPAVKIGPPPKQPEGEEKKKVIGPPKPAGAGKKKSASASKSGGSEDKGKMSYLERELDEIPLFMNELPTERSDNAAIAAMQDLAEEETPEERAEHFKNSGNECLQHGGSRWWDDAIEYYTRAIRCGSKDFPKVSIYFSNRAAVQILKENWGHAIKDCLEALRLDAGNVKAMYRASKSYYELRKLTEALKYLRMAMSKTKTVQLIELEKDIARQMRKQRLKEEKKNKETELTLEKDLDLSRILRERGYKFINDDIYSVRQRMEQYGARVELDKIEHGGREELDVTCPVVVVYPQARQSDFVQHWSEKLFIRDMLEMLFVEETTREWDQWNLYNVKELGNMCVYVKTNDKFETFEKQDWVRIKLSNTLEEAMTCDPRYLIPICPVLFVFHVSWKSTFFGKEMQETWGTPAKKIE